MTLYNELMEFEMSLLEGDMKDIKHKEGALDIYIKEEYRGMGIGTRLMNSLFEWYMYPARNMLSYTECP